MHGSWMAHGLKQRYAGSISLELEGCSGLKQSPLPAISGCSLFSQRGPSTGRNLGPWCKGRWGTLMSLDTWSIWDQKAWEVLFKHRLWLGPCITDTFSRTRGHHIPDVPSHAVADSSICKRKCFPSLPLWANSCKTNDFRGFFITQPEISSTTLPWMQFLV